jgi:hypothetical protein
MMMSEFLSKRYYAAHLGALLSPIPRPLGRKNVQSPREQNDKHAKRLIGIVLETVDGAARGVDAIARREHGPGPIKKKIDQLRVSRC